MVATLDKILKMVLASGNKEQNQHYPPHIFQEHFNLSTSWLVDEIAKLFPTTQSIIDIIRPFLETKDVIVKNGKIEFPENYRHLLGVGMFATDDFKNPCGCDEAKGGNGDCSEFKNDPLAPSPLQIQEQAAKRKCISRTVRLVDIDEWDELTTHPYKHPTYKEPIACIFRGDGIKICPYDVPSVEVRYIRQPKQYAYNYTTLPDDTYVFNSSNSVESEWLDNATSYLYKAVSTLYAMYVRDSEMRDYNVELRKIGIF